MEENGREGDDPEFGIKAQAVTAGWSSGELGSIATNGIVINGIVINGITNNGIVINGIVINGLTSSASTREFRDEMTKRNSRAFVKYAVECALSPSQSFTFTDTDGGSYTYSGALGLYTSLLDSSCGVTCQERVTSCLLARTNAQGVQERLSIRHPYAGTVTATESQLFKYREAVYMGNLFLDSSDPEALLRVAQGEATLFGQADIDYGFDRYCDGVYTTKDCPVYDTGRINEELSTHDGNPCGYGDYHCTGSASNGAATGCYASGFCAGTTYVGADSSTYQSIVTSWRPGVAPHSETSTGPALYKTDSLCAWKVAVEVGDSYCMNNYWDSLCVAEAKQYCGDHDLETTGPPLVKGDMTCINTVCEADSYCCKSSGRWDSICISEAQEMCGI